MRSLKFPHVAMLAILLSRVAPVPQAPPVSTGPILFDGARLIVGDGRVIERSAFVVANGRFTGVGQQGAVTASAGASRVDLSGKTVMPGMIDVHTHLGYRHGATFLAENFTRDTILDELDQFAARGVVAVASAGTDRGDLTLRLRDEAHAGALVRTAWRGLAPPGAGPNPPMRDAPFGISTTEQARGAVRELAARKADYVKIWVDDRNGSVPKLSPDLYRAIIADAHTHNLRVFAHIATLADAKDLLRAGVDGFLHPVRDRDVDQELLLLLKERPAVFFTLTLFAPCLNAYGSRPPWLDEPAIRASVAPDVVAQLTAVAESRRGDALTAARVEWDQIVRNVRSLNSAGVPIALGTDVGGASAGGMFGWTEHIELEHMVAAGLTPAQALAAATRTAASILRLDQLGVVATGKRADFIVLDANPLENIGNTRRIAGIAIGGVMKSR
jgi:imidazolonepropionase-like amidohydrolase